MKTAAPISLVDNRCETRIATRVSCDVSGPLSVAGCRRAVEPSRRSRPTPDRRRRPNVSDPSRGIRPGQVLPGGDPVAVGRSRPSYSRRARAVLNGSLPCCAPPVWLRTSRRPFPGRAPSVPRIARANPTDSAGDPDGVASARRVASAHPRPCCRDRRTPPPAAVPLQVDRHWRRPRRVESRIVVWRGRRLVTGVYVGQRCGHRVICE